MSIMQTRTEEVARAEVSDDYEVEITVLGVTLKLNTDDASVFADEILRACIDATVAYKEDKASGPVVGMDGKVIV